jgi:hypothetical protein
MKKFLALGTMILILAFGSAEAAKTKYKVFGLDGGDKKVFLQSGDNKYRYYVLDQGQAIDFTVNGPTRVKVRVRPALEGAIQSADYEIQIWEGDKLVTGRKVNSGKSGLAAEEKDAEVGLARDVFFKVPKGNHSYRVKVLSQGVKKSYLRFYQEKKKKSAGYATYKPSEFKETIRLKSKKSDITYFQVDTDGGVKLSVLGPAEVRIYCRANFDKNIKDKTKFALGVYENGESVKKFTGIAKKSMAAIYSDRADLIPSTLHKYVLNVPSGKHEYTLRKVNSSAPSLSIRFKMKADSLGKKK